jgi:hypothetical protein
MTKPLRCSSAAASELSIGILSVDQTSTRGWRPAPRRAGAGKALVGRDDGLALRIMSGDNATYFECHGFPPLRRPRPPPEN